MELKFLYNIRNKLYFYINYIKILLINKTFYCNTYKSQKKHIENKK